jgi:hypothetical protein
VTTDQDAVDVAAVTRALRDSFPYVRAFHDKFGIHYLCSDRPIPQRTAKELLQRMPAKAVSDLVEWDAISGNNSMDAAEDRLSDLLRGEVAVDELIAGSPGTPAITDDRPINEYYLIRRWRSPANQVRAMLQ